jgi:glycosyltransferase involved in cell wall biosynthesis
VSASDSHTAAVHTAAVHTPVLHIGKVKGVSGSENHLLLLLPRLRERGWDVRFLLLHEDEPGALEFAQRLEGVGVPVEDVRLGHPASPRTFARVLRVIREQGPTIVHTHLVHADFLGLTAARLARVPVRISTKHGFNAFRSSRAFSAADRTVSRLADVDIAISDGLARYLEETEGFARGTFEVVHYGIEPAAACGPPPERPALAIVGRLIPIKGHDDLLDALTLLGADVPFTLDVVGDGELRATLEARAAALGLADRVRFRGRVSPVAPAFEDAAIVVVPSHGEGFGLVALEAMERGRAVVATAVGGLPEIVEDGVTGLVVPPRDADALAAALRTLLGDPARVAAMGAAGRRRAVEEFSQARCTDRTEALYEAALVEAGVPRLA